MINFLSQQTEVNDRPLDSIPSLSRLILHLVARDELGPLSMDEAYHFLNDTSISPKDYSIFAEENETHYSRNRLFLGKNMELLVLTWKPGQASRIHDHQGSVCCIKVLEGQGLEIKFTKTNCGKYIPRISETIKVAFE